MPWSVADVDRFNRGLSDAKKRQWVATANDTLSRTGDEGQSIRTANAAVREVYSMADEISAEMSLNEARRGITTPLAANWDDLSPDLRRDTGIAAMASFREGSDDHFYGAWSGGSKSEGGHAMGPANARDASHPSGSTDVKYGYSLTPGDGKGPGWVPERAKLHDEYINEITKGVPKADGAPTVSMTGGGPASGKSEGLLNNEGTGLPAMRGQAVHIDADQAKEKLPEYVAGVKAKNKTAASYTHEESSYMTKAALSTALANGQNVVFDSVADGGVESLAAKVAKMRAAGAKVINADYATVPLAEAYRRSDARALDKGRFVPHAVIAAGHVGVSQTVSGAIDRNLFDRLRIWDTSGDTPRIIAAMEGGKLVVSDQKAFDAFKALGAQ